MSSKSSHTMNNADSSQDTRVYYLSHDALPSIISVTTQIPEAIHQINKSLNAEH